MKLRATEIPMDAAVASPVLAETETDSARIRASISEALVASTITSPSRSSAPAATTVLRRMPALTLPPITLVAIAPPPLKLCAPLVALTATETDDALATALMVASSSAVRLMLPSLARTRSAVATGRPSSSRNAQPSVS